MELTEAQKKISTSQAFWEMQERKKKQVELWQQHPMTVEEVGKALETRKAFLAKDGERIWKERHGK